MKAMIFYRPNSEHERMVEEYVHDFARHTGKELPTVDVDSRDGIYLTQLYDVTRYPSIVAVDDEGKVLQTWEDSDILPRFDEVSYYVEG
jgi:hypothetical protein